MLWVMIMVAIAVIGVVMVVCYARWLWHKASDVMSEVTVVLERLGQLGELLGRIQPLESPSTRPGPGQLVVEMDADPDGAGDEDDDWAADARELRLRREAATSSRSTPGARRVRESETTSAT